MHKGDDIMYEEKYTYGDTLTYIKYNPNEGFAFGENYTLTGITYDFDGAPIYGVETNEGTTLYSLDYFLKVECTEIPDMVNQPNHYLVGGIEVLDYIRAKLTPEEFKGYLKGNILKYISRASYKGQEFTDMEKAGVYLDEYRKVNKMVEN